MQRHAVLELRNIIISRLLVSYGSCTRYPNPDGKQEKSKSTTQAKSRTQAICFGKFFNVNSPFGRFSSLRISHTLPASRNTAPCKFGNHTEAILDIGFYANITHVVDIGIFPHPSREDSRPDLYCVQKRRAHCWHRRYRTVPYKVRS